MPVDLGGDRVAALQLTRLDLAVVAEHIGLDLLRVADAEKGQARAALGELAAVANLPSRLRIERRAIEHNHPALPG